MRTLISTTKGMSKVARETSVNIPQERDSHTLLPSHEEIRSLEKDNDLNPTSASNSSESSRLPDGCSVNNLRPMAQGCQFLNENDGSLQYSDGWSFSSSDPNGLVHTLHFTQTPGCSVSLRFNASSVVVFGLVPAGSSPPQASYSIDGLPPISPHMAATSACVPNQQLFNSGTLDAGLHNLTIEVTEASHDRPYILDYLWLCGAGAVASGGLTAVTQTRSKSSNVGIIIGVVLGAVALLLAIATCVWLYVRRRTQRLESPSDALQKRRSTSSDIPGTVTPFPVPTSDSRRLSEPRVMPHSDILATLSSLEDGISLSGGSNVGTGHSASTVVWGNSDGPPSSLAPALSTTSTVLARRLEEATLFRSLIPFRRSQPTLRRSHSTAGGGTSMEDEPPPPYASG